MMVDAKSKTIGSVRAEVGMVFQRFNLFPHMTALGNIIEGPVQVRRRPNNVVKEEALALLHKVGLSDKAGSYPSQLSGGQQQRIAIARALAMKPRAMLVRRADSALDRDGRRRARRYEGPCVRGHDDARGNA